MFPALEKHRRGTNSGGTPPVLLQNAHQNRPPLPLALLLLHVRVRRSLYRGRIDSYVRDVFPRWKVTPWERKPGRCLRDAPASRRNVIWGSGGGEEATALPKGLSACRGSHGVVAQERGMVRRSFAANRTRIHHKSHRSHRSAGIGTRRGSAEVFAAEVRFGVIDSRIPLVDFQHERNARAV